MILFFDCDVINTSNISQFALDMDRLLKWQLRNHHQRRSTAEFLLFFAYFDDIVILETFIEKFAIFLAGTRTRFNTSCRRTLHTTKLSGPCVDSHITHCTLQMHFGSNKQRCCQATCCCVWRKQNNNQTRLRPCNMRCVHCVFSHPENPVARNCQLLLLPLFCVCVCNNLRWMVEDVSNPHVCVRYMNKIQH